MNLTEILQQEEIRQRENIELIASENYVSEEVLKFQGSIFTNKYAEWYPGKRYYHGCENVDLIEETARKEAQNLFDTDYYVNVQPHSGSSANMAVYFFLHHLVGWNLRVLGMGLDGGGHLTHWAVPSFSGEKFNIFKSQNYGVNEIGFLDYEAIEKQALEFKPHLIIAGASAYARVIDFKRFRAIADKVGAYLLVDMAHIAGLVATELHPSPFGIADFVTSTTHKTLRGPRSGIIFTQSANFAKGIDSVIFPGLQGGPLEHIIAAKAQCFLEAQTSSYKQYMERVVYNTRLLGTIFQESGIDLVTWGTDNHLLLLDFRNFGLKGKEVADALEHVNITVNKNSVPGDLNPVSPSGIRIGTPAITSRGITREGIIQIGESIVRVVYALKEWRLTEEFIKEEKQKNIELVKDLSIYPTV